jgi:hypothetical protein
MKTFRELMGDGGTVFAKEETSEVSTPPATELQEDAGEAKDSTSSVLDRVKKVVKAGAGSGSVRQGNGHHIVKYGEEHLGKVVDHLDKEFGKRSMGAWHADGHKIKSMTNAEHGTHLHITHPAQTDRAKISKLGVANHNSVAGRAHARAKLYGR